MAPRPRLAHVQVGAPALLGHRCDMQILSPAEHWGVLRLPHSCSWSRSLPPSLPLTLTYWSVSPPCVARPHLMSGPSGLLSATCPLPWDSPATVLRLLPWPLLCQSAPSFLEPTSSSLLLVSWACCLLAVSERTQRRQIFGDFAHLRTSFFTPPLRVSLPGILPGSGCEGRLCCVSFLIPSP